MKKFLTAVGLICVVFSCGLASEPIEVAQRGYTTTTLRDPVFDVPKLVVEATAINNWLNQNYETLAQDQMKGPREHIYYLIDSYVKNIYTRESVILPKEHDLLLAMLFSWVERLGVYGGTLAYNAVKSPDSPKMPTYLVVPEGMTLSLESDLFIISSITGSWRVKVPYYFMIWGMNNFTATNGMTTQLVSLSTGVATDVTETGHSQATLMVIYSVGADIEEFSQFWKDGLGIGNDAETLDLPMVDRESFHSFDAETKLHKEINIWKGDRGSYAVAYLGMDGAYQWNRPHYIDFMNAIEVGGILPPNQ
ncbi:MAG: hypothetical protein DRR42_22920 [Gammaproteobacteria bacterium]|nr:MAG: hypothetical protein DRR42_22920 [Gammaproteobacteria bacterium]